MTKVNKFPKKHTAIFDDCIIKTTIKGIVTMEDGEYFTEIETIELSNDKETIVYYDNPQKQLSKSLLKWFENQYAEDAMYNIDEDPSDSVCLHSDKVQL